MSKYGRKVASATILDGIFPWNIAIFDGGYVKIGSKYQKLLGISGDTQLTKKTGLGRSVATLATFATPWPGFNLLSPGQRGVISLSIVTDKKTWVFSSDQVDSASVGKYQKILAAGTTVIEMQRAKEQGPNSSETVETDLSTQLKQLGELHAQGILSEEEFTSAKAKLLGNS